MAKKLISIVLSVIMAFSVFAICSFAGDTITAEDKSLYPAEELAIADPKERIDRALLTGRTGGGANIQDTAASKDVIEDNLYFWKDEIIDEYHALEAKGDAATDEEWGALYRKMKTPHDNDFDMWADFWYEYKAPEKAKASAKFVASKTELQPGEEFTVDLYTSTNFYFAGMYATVFYDNSVVDVVACSETHRGTPDTEDEINVHELGEAFSKWDYLEVKHFGDYDLAYYGDKRHLEWPDSIKSEEGAYDKYEAYNVGIYPVSSFLNVAPMKGDDIKVITYKFKVKDTATPGSSSKIFCPNDSIFTLSKQLDYEADSMETLPTWQYYRCDKDSNALIQTFADSMYCYDQALSIEGTEVTVAGGSQVEYADYTELDAAIAGFDSSVSGLYTASTWSAYASAVTAGSNVARDLTKDQQATVDAATKAITDAKAALALNKLVSVDVIGTPTIGSNANVQIVANGSPKAIRLVGDGDNALTFNREDAVITTNGDNEVWNIKVAATTAHSSYNVFGRWGEEYNDAGLALEINATEGLDLSIHSILIPDMYPTGTYMDGKIYSGIHDVIIRTSKDVFKVQLIDPDGNTRTFDKVTWTPVEDGDELVWTVKVNFYLGSFNYGLRTRAENTTFALTGDYITGRGMF